ncbi:Pseudouridine kinase [Anaerotruncus sp. 2789STDY5834896]|uniref:Pseudouridine kinase n=1 Tax=uncultured Anaerotruncus sp. TaxID=905011 RepID=A0A1C6FYP5_9FIRM|nr:Pseudouridine kinase [uncultured Anaerotruncus sp.]
MHSDFEDTAKNPKYGAPITKREAEILAIIRKNPMISHQELADMLGITRSAASVHLTNLTKKGKIKGRGYILEQPNYATIIGAANMDINGFSFEPMVAGSSNPGRISLVPGGEARNLAENLARLGINAKLMAPIGGDMFGEKIVADCRALGIDTSDCLLLPNASTSLFMAFINSGGDMAMGLSDMRIEDNITPEYVQRKSGILAGSKVIVLGSGLPPETLQYVLENFPQKEIIMDVGAVGKCKRFVHLLDRMCTLQLNRIEAEFISGISIVTAQDAIRAAKHISKMGPKRVFITLGVKGCAVVTPREEGFFHTRARRPVSTTGVGQAYTAGIVYGAIYDLSLTETVQFAMACSTLTLQSESAVNRALNLQAVEQVVLDNQEY